MTHAEAVEKELVEKYLLAELDETEREEFELHFFSCPECASSLKDGAMLMDGAKPLLQPLMLAPREAARIRSRWWRPFGLPQFAVPAVAALFASGLIYLGHENGVMRRELTYYTQPRQVAEFTLLPATRGPEQTFDISRGAREIQFSIDAPADEPFASYRCEVRGAPDAPLLSIPLKNLKPGQPVQLSMRAPRADTELQFRIFGVTPGGAETEIFSRSARVHIQEEIP